MTLACSNQFLIRDAENDLDALRGEVIAGLTRPRKSLPCKLFYDDAGSALFDQICDLPEYYLTRTEMQIMRECAADIRALIGPRATVIEYGSGNSLKTRVLLDALDAPAAYVPVDISCQQLRRSAVALSAEYPVVHVLPLCADYTGNLSLPLPSGPVGRRLIYFPGSTIGNFNPPAARAFLRRAAGVAGSDGGLLIGVDLKKDPRQLHAAYNDTAGVTAAFNLNLLTRLNRELNADFNLDRFHHYAFYKPSLGRIEMHLISSRRQTVHVDDQSIHFEEGESIHTESSYKRSPRSFARLAASAGWRVARVWTDAKRLFSVQYLNLS